MFCNIKIFFGVPRGLVVFRDVEVLNVGFLDVRMSIGHFNLPVANTLFELNFKTRKKSCHRSMRVHLTHCVARKGWTLFPEGSLLRAS